MAKCNHLTDLLFKGLSNNLLTYPSQQVTSSVIPEML